MPSILPETKSTGPSIKFSSNATSLTHADRCDAGTTVGVRSECGARAYVAVMIPTAGGKGFLPLHFCAHHYHKHEDALWDAAAMIVDERHLLDSAVQAQKRADH